MFRAFRECLLGELLEHPVLSVEMTNRGIERRCFELIFGAAGAHHRFAETECDGAASDLRSAPTLPPAA